MTEQMRPDFYDSEDDDNPPTCEGCADCLEEPDGVLLADGFEEAFVGFGTHFTNPVAVYDRNKCLEILRRDGASWDEAVEFFDFNVTGAWVGPNTPVFVTLRCPECRDVVCRRGDESSRLVP